MPSYTAPTQDMAFLLHNVLKAEQSDIPGYGTWNVTSPARFWKKPENLRARCWPPLNTVGDQEGCRLENGIVYTPDRVQGRVRTGERRRMDRAGYAGRIRRPEYARHSGYCRGRAVFVRQPGVHHVSRSDPRRSSAILAHGTDEQKATYLPRWSAANGPAP